MKVDARRTSIRAKQGEEGAERDRKKRLKITKCSQLLI
jgi:hypothetical protein